MVGLKGKTNFRRGYFLTPPQARLFALWELLGPNGVGVETIFYMDVDFIIVDQERGVDSILKHASSLNHAKGHSSLKITTVFTLINFTAAFCQ